MENKHLYFMQIVWAGMGIACIIMGIYSLITRDWEQAVFFGITTGVAIIMFSLRRYQFKNSQKRNAANSGKATR